MRLNCSRYLYAMVVIQNNGRVRRLIEELTGYYTGSIYRDRQLQAVLKGEGVCNSSTVVVKWVLLCPAARVKYQFVVSACALYLHSSTSS